MTATRTPQEKVGDWNAAFEPIRDSITTHEMRAMQSAMTEVQVPKTTDDIGAFQAWVALVQETVKLSRLIAANDRAAAIAAAMLVQSGVSRPVISTDEEGDNG